jgi:hypothetical protein
VLVDFNLTIPVCWDNDLNEWTYAPDNEFGRKITHTSRVKVLTAGEADVSIQNQ